MEVGRKIDALLEAVGSVNLRVGGETRIWDTCHTARSSGSPTCGGLDSRCPPKYVGVYDDPIIQVSLVVLIT